MVSTTFIFEDLCANIFNKKISMQVGNELYKEFVIKFLLEKESGDEWRQKNQTLFNKIHDEFKPCLALENILPIIHILFETDTSKSYDALLYLENDREIEVECVTAMDQYDWALRREHMDQYGRVPLFADIQTSPGSKNKRKIENTPCLAISCEDAKKRAIDQFNERILESFKNKVDKQNECQIYQNTILIIYIQDNYYALNPKEYSPELNIIAQLLKRSDHKFKGVYIVGTSGNVIIVDAFEQSS